MAGESVKREKVNAQPYEVRVVFMLQLTSISFHFLWLSFLSSKLLFYNPSRPFLFIHFLSFPPFLSSLAFPFLSNLSSAFPLLYIPWLSLTWFHYILPADDAALSRNCIALSLSNLYNQTEKKDFREVQSMMKGYTYWDSVLFFRYLSVSSFASKSYTLAPHSVISVARWRAALTSETFRKKI